MKPRQQQQSQGQREAHPTPRSATARAAHCDCQPWRASSGGESQTDAPRQQPESVRNASSSARDKAMSVPATRRAAAHAGHIRSGALRRLGTACRRPASRLRVQRQAAHTLHRLPFTSSCWPRRKPAAAHRARRQAHGDAPPPHGSLIALTFARGGGALRLAACSRSLAGRLPGPARKARGPRPRLPGRLPRTLLGRRSHRSRCLPAESVCGSCALCHFVARV
jgi:hypothetical protein